MRGKLVLQEESNRSYKATVVKTVEYPHKGRQIDEMAKCSEIDSHTYGHNL